MALATKRFSANTPAGVASYIKLSDTSAGNTALTVTSPLGRPVRFIAGWVRYSATPVQTGVTFNVDSGLGTAYDGILATGGANALVTALASLPDCVIDETDAFAITAPAAGGVITSSIVLIVEEL